MSQAEVTADPARRGGYALVRVPDAAPLLSDPRFRIQRQDERHPFLGPHGWQTNESFLSPANCWTEGEDLVLELGPAVVDQVEEGTVVFSLPAGKLNLTLIWPALAPSRRDQLNIAHVEDRPKPKPKGLTGGLNGTNGGPTLQETPKQTLKEPEVPQELPKPPEEKPTIVKEEEIFVPKEQEKKQEKNIPKPVPKPFPWPLVGGAFALIVIGIVALIFWPKPGPNIKPSPNIQNNQQSQGNQPIPPVQATSTCDSEPYPAVLQCEKNRERLYYIALNLEKAGQMPAAVAVLGISAEDNFGPAALALAQLYDPATFEQNAAIQQPDPAMAARYYKLAVTDGDQAAMLPRSILYNYLQNLKAQGDMQAPLTLNDYWP